MKRILIVTHHFAPYRDDTFKQIESKYNYKIKFLITEGNITHKEWNYNFPKFDYEVGNKGRKYGSLGILYDKYIELLRAYNPEIVITSGNIALLLYTKLFHKQIKVIFCSDQIKEGKNAKSPINYFILKKIYNLADGIWTTGIAGEKYFSKYLKSTTPIRMGCYTNDINRIINNFNKYDKSIERKKLNINEEDYIFLMVGKLIPSRRVGRILNIAARMSNEAKVHFLIVGDGPESDLVKRYIRFYDNLTYIPALSIEELEKAYAISDAYVYLGWEPYSLALYEAAILGMPIIANGEIGAMYDCVENEVNGISLNNFDAGYIIEKMHGMIAGKYSDGACKKASFIHKERGVTWAANQLIELIEG